MKPLLAALAPWLFAIAGMVVTFASAQNLVPSQASTGGNQFTSINVTGTGTLVNATVTGNLETSTLIANQAVQSQVGTCATTGFLGGVIAGRIQANGACSAGSISLQLPYSFNGWVCDFHDLTTPANVINQTSYAVNTVTAINVTLTSGDVIAYKCAGF